jgi:deoxyribodipyrimidine photo-lyase
VNATEDKQSLTVVWFKRDLRIRDHRPLLEGSRAGLCLPLFVVEPDYWRQPDSDRCHYDFCAESVQNLDEQLRRLGGRLLIRVGNVVEVFDQLAREYRIEKIVSHVETGNGWTYRRDLEVGKWLRSRGIPWLEFRQNGVIRRLATRDGWSNQWTSFMRQRFVEYLPAIRVPEQLESHAWPSSVSLGLGGLVSGRVQVGGESLGQETLESFLQVRGADYRRGMSSPNSAEEVCSRLSPYLAWGCVSIRDAWQRLQQRRSEVRHDREAGRDTDPRWAASLASFQSRLSWHCHFMQKLEDEPQLEFRNLNRAYDGLREDEFDHERFAAWAEGRTGYPLIDACMRALQQQRWINFRMRAMLVSFAAYHLWLHWREPALHLAKVFLDYEPGIHYSQCQMQSGTTGINTVRIYSPTKQAKDQDPQGTFIRRFIPELANCPLRFLHEPWLMSRDDQQRYGCWLGRDYPFRIVDHEAAVKAAKDRIYAVRRSLDATQAAQKVLKKHGSRKRRDTLPKQPVRPQAFLPGFEEPSDH